MNIGDVASALSHVAYTVQNSTLIAEQLRIVARAAAADGSLAAWLRLLEWFQESLQARRSMHCVSCSLVCDRMQPDAEELLYVALAALSSNERFVAAFRGDDGRCLRERVRRISMHIADRPEGNACRELISGFYGVGNDDERAVGGDERREARAADDWPIESGASVEQLQQQKAILRRLRSWEKVGRSSSHCSFRCWLLFVLVGNLVCRSARFQTTMIAEIGIFVDVFVGNSFNKFCA